MNLIRFFVVQVELTGDFTPDMRALLSADIIISTPEKWDGISRNWHNRSYVTKVCSNDFKAKTLPHLVSG